jgi:hypothetical protein
MSSSPAAADAREPPVCHWQTPARRDGAQIRWSCATGTHAPWSYLGLAEPEGLSGGCGIGAIGSGPAA